MNIVEVQLENKQVARFIPVPSDKVFELWPSVQEHAQQALAHSFDDMTQTQLLDWALCERVTLILITIDERIVASLTMELQDSSRGRTCHIVTLAGDDMDVWLDTWIEVWKKIAKEHGADFISMRGRKGWERATKKYGFTHQYTQMQLDIRNFSS